jgi:hypothetical protein
MSFDTIAPPYMKLFMSDFDAELLDAGAVFGNAGYESRGFEDLQELNPVIPGSRGGWGWFQWTAGRRVAMEAYANRHGYDLAAPETNYKWLFLELRNEEAAALTALKGAQSLEQKVKAFELSFERAGIKRYPERVKWARRALDAYHAMYSVEPDETPAEIIARIRVDLDKLEKMVG